LSIAEEIKKKVSSCCVRCITAGYFIKDILKKYYERELIISAYYENDDLLYEHFHVLCI